MSKLIDLLWSGRKRPNAQLQERIARSDLFRPHPARHVTPAPQHPPIRKDDKR